MVVAVFPTDLSLSLERLNNFIKRKKEDNDLNIIVVVSAMGKMTDTLINLSKKITYKNNTPGVKLSMERSRNPSRA